MTFDEQLEAKAKELTKKFCTNNGGFKWNEQLYARILGAMREGAILTMKHISELLPELRKKAPE